MRVRQDTAPHLFAVESETDSEQWYQVFANGRSEEHTSELQSPCNLVCRLILSEEHTSELQSPCNLVCRLLLEKKKTRGPHDASSRICPQDRQRLSQSPRPVALTGDSHLRVCVE